MASSNEYRDFILEQLNSLQFITCRAMMGEFLLYCNGILFGGIYDDRVLVKITENNSGYRLKEEIPYKGAKPMFLVDCVDNPGLFKKIVLETCAALSEKK